MNSKTLGIGYNGMVLNTANNESTAGADASVEMPKLDNYILLYTQDTHDKQFNFAARKNSESG